MSGYQNADRPPSILVVPGVQGAVTAAAPGAGFAVANRFALTSTAVFRYGMFEVTTQSGNIELFIAKLSGTGHGDYTKVATTGVIACPNVGYQRLDFGATSLTAGDYAMGLFASASLGVRGATSRLDMDATRRCVYLAGLGAGPVPGSGTFTFGGAQALCLALDGDY